MLLTLNLLKAITQKSAKARMVSPTAVMDGRKVGKKYCQGFSMTDLMESID